MIKTSTPADTDTGAAIIAQMLTNDKQNLTQDENAVLNSGIAEGTIVKYSAERSKWVACDGTVALSDTDSVGIVTYADGTSGQVKTSGVYVNDELSTVGKYYCQSDGSIGTTATKVFVGNITSPGRLCLPGGSGGGGSIATATSLGQVMIGNGINVDSQGKISSPHGKQIYTTPGSYSWMCPAGVTSVLVTIIGAGGGGAGGANMNAGWGGGGANIIREYPYVVTPGNNYTITVGNGGSGGTATTGDNTAINAGSSGGQSSFGSLVATGGAGGTQNAGNGAFSLSGGIILNNGTSDGAGGGQFGGTKAVANNNSASTGGIGSGGGAGFSHVNASQRTSGGNGGPGMVLLVY